MDKIVTTTTGDDCWLNYNGTITMGESTPTESTIKKILGLLGFTIGEEEVMYIKEHWND